VKDGEDFCDKMEQVLVDKDYKIWNKSTSFLHNFEINHAFECYFLIIQWLFDCDELLKKHYSVQKMVSLYHTSNDEPNYLTLTHVNSWQKM